MTLNTYMAIHAAGIGFMSMPDHGHPERQFGRKRKGGKDKGGVAAASPGGMETGSSKTLQECYVIDPMGRKVSTHRTVEEANRAQAARRYAKVRCRIPEDTTPKVRDKARRRQIDKDGPFDRRTAPYPNLFERYPSGLLN